MTTPSRRDAAAALSSLRPPPWLLRHSCAVAEVAGWLARSARTTGRHVDQAAVEAAALLHDVDKALPAGDPARRLRHGAGSAAWLTRIGLEALAPLVTDHPVTRLAQDDGWQRLAAAPIEARIVAYADKRAGQRLEPMDARFASWRRRYPAGPRDHDASTGPNPGTGTGWDDATARLVRARADALEADVCAAAGVRPAEVRRLRWARAALASLARA